MKIKIRLLIITLILALITFYCIKKYGYRYAGIKELRNLEKRVELLENKFKKVAPTTRDK